MKDVPKDIIRRTDELARLVTHHQRLYHQEDAPEISDETYDSLARELLEVIEKYPTLAKKYTQAVSIGGRPNDAFKKVTHKVRQWSYDNVFSDEELEAWGAKLFRFLTKQGIRVPKLSYVSEHKIDGLKIILEYKKGKLMRATTRGDGVVGEDITHTAKTIKDIPHKLKKKITLIAVGEAWLSKKEFVRLNAERERDNKLLFANPRNAAAGSVRQLDSSVAKSRNLSFFTYDIDFIDETTLEEVSPSTQYEELKFLKKLGFTTNPHTVLCKTLNEAAEEYKKWVPKKNKMPYGMDGTVLKVNNINIQQILGYTAKSPRFGIAYKFPAEEATTVIENIVLQIGRTGVLTPVAHLRPVRIDGSTVSRATLHNEDQIKRLDVRIGDTIILQKAGDVIPEILRVVKKLRPNKSTPYKFPQKVTECGGDGSIERIPGMAAYRCVEKDSDTLHRRRLYYFVSKNALNIDGVGPRIIDSLLDNNLINTPSDLFTITEGDLLTLPGFKKKAAQNVVNAIDAAREVSLNRLLVALSIDHVGEETARIIAERFPSLETLRNASEEELSAVYGIGDIVVESLRSWLKSADHRKELDILIQNLKINVSDSSKSEALSGKILVFTGTLPTLSRSDAKTSARNAGAKIVNSVSKNTNYVVIGKNPGSKAEKAKILGVSILSEQEFLKLVEG